MKLIWLQLRALFWQLVFGWSLWLLPEECETFTILEAYGVIVDSQRRLMRAEIRRKYPDLGDPL